MPCQDDMVCEYILKNICARLDRIAPIYSRGNREIEGE